MSDSELPSHLVRANPEQFSIQRHKWGRGYRYLHEDERPINAELRFQHIPDLPVPDTWTEVRYCGDPNAHILALGYDGSAKLQYLYHPDYLSFRNEQKFAGLVDFGLSLPRIRRRLRKDLKEEEWSERKLMALLVRILDKHHLRIGSRVYARKNKSFGLTTLRKKHLHEKESELYFSYTGKSHQQREIRMSDPALVSLIEELADFSGWELFSFRHKGEEVKADASKVNDYIREVSGGDFTARDFRTWAGTVLSVKYHLKARKVVDKNPRKQLKSTLVGLVAERLGNTPSICEDYYIHPKVLSEAQQPDFDSTPCREEFLRNSLYRKSECRTMEILQTQN